MAVLGRLLVSSAERLDLPDLLSLDSYAAGDWQYFLKSLVGDSKPFILKGFDVIDPGNAIGTQSCSIRVADSITYYPGSNSGSFYHGLPEGNPNALPLVPELRKNAVNYVYLTFSTFNTSLDTRAFWDPDKDGGAGGEFTQDVNTESVLQVQVNVSTGSFPANTVPVAKITVGPVVITAIEDARDMMFRLGSGGVSPNPFNTYTWRSLPGAGYEREEPLTTMTAGGVNPFQGADKNILTLKEWMDAVMSKLRELGGTTYWYEDASTFSVISNFFDAIATTFQSKGQWVHDSSTPGLLTWTEDIHIKMTSDPRTYVLRAGNKTLTNEQVAYIPMTRDQPFNATDQAVSWTNGQPYINTVGGAVGLFANLSKGNYVKKITDSFDKFLRVEEFYDAVNLGGSVTTAALARSVRLNSNYLGTTGIEKGRYDKGAYVTGDVVVSDRNSAAIAVTGGNFHWLAIRSDTIENVGSAVSHTLALAISEHDSATAKVTSVAHGLIDGDRITISGTTNFNGTFKVEVETVDIFYISLTGGPFANESGSGFYATVTTTSRSTAYGFLEESATHGFRSDDTIIIAGTTNYNGSRLINVVNNTSFTIPISAAFATESTGTATLARVIIRNEGTGVDLIQGQSVDIGGSVADNIRQFVGMNSLSETFPSYSIPPTYNTLDGMQNYNSTINENLTFRISKLTAMMADKAQDKTIKLLPAGYASVTNTTNGANQDITFNPNTSPPPILNVILPGSANNGTVGLTGTLSLAANQAAYITIDRNSAFSFVNLSTVTVASIASVPIQENTLVLAVRLSGNDVWLWDGFLASPGTTPIHPNFNAKLIGGGILANVAGSGTTISSNTTFNNTGNLVVTPGGGSPNGQSWQAGVTGTVDTVRLSLQKNGAPTGTFTLGLYNAAFDGIGFVPTGSPIATSSTTVDVSTVPLTFTDYDFSFSSVPVLSGNFYAWVADNTNITAASVINSIQIHYNTPSVVPGNVVTGGAVYPSVGSWTNLAALDFVFEVFGASTVDLTFTEPMYLEVPGLDYIDNTIPITESPITFTNNYDVAYVQPNFSSGGPNLTVTVDTLPNVPNGMVIIARREGTDIIIGSSSMRLIIGESKKIYAGSSIQTLTYTGQPDEADATPTYTNVTNGLAPYPVVQGDDLTLAIGQVIGDLNSIFTTLDQPSYDEFREVVAAAPTGNQITPVLSGATLTLPNNSRLTGTPVQFYTVGKGALEIFLNGQILQLGEAGGWTEVGAPASASNQIIINQDLVVGDFLTFRIDATGGPGSGGAGAPDDDFFTLPTNVTPDNGDYVLTYDVSTNTYRKQTRATFLSGIGGFLNVNGYAADHLADINTDDVILMDAQLAARTVTLPPAATADGKIFYIKKVDSSGNAVIIDADGLETIDGALTVTTVVQYESFTITSDGSSWWIL